MSRLEQAAAFGAMMGKAAFYKRAEGPTPMPAGGRRTITPAQRQDVDEIINGFNGLKEPVDPKALMAGRPVRVGAGESTFSPNPLPAKRPQLSNKDISGMQGAFGNQASFAQKTSPVVKNPMLSQPPAGPRGFFSNAQIDPANQNPGNYPHNAPTAHPGPRPSMR